MDHTLFARGSLFVSLVLVAAGCSEKAKADPACLVSAFTLMEGTFKAEGKRRDDQGDLNNFTQTFRVAKDGDRSITMYSGAKKYGSWRLTGEQYELVTYDTGGAAIGSPVAVRYSCSYNEAKKTAALVERWDPPAEADGKTWELMQSREVSDNGIQVATTAREKGSTFPWVVLTRYKAERVN